MIISKSILFQISDIVDRAIIFATQAHSGSLRKGTNLPYIVHPLEAGTIVSSMTNDREMIAAAILHDTVEDTDTSLDDIKNLFGDRVAKLVSSETENKRTDLPASDTWRIRKQETIDYLASSSHDEKILVLGDKLSNLRAMYRDYISIGDDLWNRFNQKDKFQHSWYYHSISDALSELSQYPAYNEYIKLLDCIF